MAAADALVVLGFILILGLLAYLFTDTVRKNSKAAVRAAESRATRAEAAIGEVVAYAAGHYVEPEVQVIRDILSRHGFGDHEPV